MGNKVGPERGAFDSGRGYFHAALTLSRGTLKCEFTDINLWCKNFPTHHKQHIADQYCGMQLHHQLV